jgi:hypothetical protein
MTRFKVLCLALLCSGITQAQELISSAGQSAIITNMTVEWSLGEIVIQEANLSSNSFTQGLHQPKYAPSGHRELENFEIELFPNPFSQEINIRSLDQASYTGKIYNPLGQVVRSFQFKDNLKLELEELEASFYMIQLKNTDNQSIKEFKIIKSH